MAEIRAALMAQLAHRIRQGNDPLSKIDLDLLDLFNDHRYAALTLIP